MTRGYLVRLARAVFGLLALACLAAAVEAQTGDLKSELTTLVRSELAFAKAAADKGTREAFLTFLAEQSVVFRPQPVDGRKLYSESSAAGGLLSWYPVVADVSRTGDLGYTTGPYEFRTDKAGDAVRHGNYVSLWRKQSDGTWKVILDTGITNPPPSSRPAAWQPPASYKPSFEKAESSIDPKAERSKLLDTEREFSSVSQSQGAAEAYAAYLADDSRFLRPDALPVSRKSAVVAALSGRKEAWTWQPFQAEVARGADLGYTYGTIAIRTRAAAMASIQYYYYTRIWKRNSTGAWQLALDVASPGPPPQPKQ